jgi:PAT family beta-lactamase induction signal transducer AmpG
MTTSRPAPSRLRQWSDSIGVYRERPVITLLFLGFSSGLPLLLVFGTLSFWLREAGLQRSTIGFLSWVALPYAFKWAWSPLVDRLPIPWLTPVLGRRRAWLLASQIALALAIVGMALSDPQLDLWRLATLGLLVAFLSATQDIVIDAYRIDSADTRVQAAMASTYIIGYRLAMISASAGVLWIAAWLDTDDGVYQYVPWRNAYLTMAGLMLVGIVTTLVAREPSVRTDAATAARENLGADWLRRHATLPTPVLNAAEWIWRAVVSPFVDFVGRYRWYAVLLLVLIATYRISDVVLGVITNVFYVDMGYTKDEVANVTKVFGVLMTIVGSVVGGVLVNRTGVMPILFVGGALAASTNLLFAMLAGMAPSVPMLAAVVAMDNLSAGLASAAFVAYLSGLTNVSYSATQYALFSSMMLLLPKFIGGFSGVIVDGIGYASFFTLTAAMGMPVMVVIWLAWRHLPADDPRPRAEVASPG